MKNNYDVVIIGAGISGLSAGMLLSKKGKRVFILESQPKIGGYLCGERYAQLKEKVIGDVLSTLEKLIPELKDRSIIDVCELGTPYTNERYTGNTNGVALGFNFDGYRLGPSRIRSYYNHLSNASSLYFVGHQTGYGGGLNVAFGSAKKVTSIICR